MNDKEINLSKNEEDSIKFILETKQNEPLEDEKKLRKTSNEIKHQEKSLIDKIARMNAEFTRSAIRGIFLKWQ